MPSTQVSVVSITTPLKPPQKAKVKRNNQLVAVEVFSHILESGTSFNMVKFEGGHEEKVHNTALVWK